METCSGANKETNMESITAVQQTETSKTAIATGSGSLSMISGSSGSGGLGDTSQATEKPTVQLGQAKQEECKSNKTHRRKGTAQKVDSFFRFWKPIFRVLACMLWLGKRPLDKKSSSKSLSTYFFSLPTELQLEIVNQLSIHEIIHLRQTSRAFSLLIQCHESHIVKQHIKTWMPKYISILFPLPTTESATLKFLETVTYRREVSDSLADALAQRIVREMGKGRPQKPPVSPKVLEYVTDKLKLGFSPLILAIFHFLETYHRRKSQELSGTGPFNESTLEAQELEIQSNIMLQYPDCLLLQIHQMFHLLLHLLTRRLGNLYWYSKRIGMWHGAPTIGKPDDEDLAKLLLLGGIPEIARLLKLKGRAKRRREFYKNLKKMDSRGPSEAPAKYHGGTVVEGLSINIDKLSRIWVPAAEKQLLSRGIVTNLANIRCCGEFVAELLGDEFTSVAESSILGEDENADDTAGQSAQLIAAMNFGHSHLRFADDGNWDQNLIVEGDDEDEDYLEAIEAKGKEGHGEKRPPTPPSKPVAGPSKSPGTIVGMTAPVPGCSGTGYNGMGATFMSMAL